MLFMTSLNSSSKYAVVDSALSFELAVEVEGLRVAEICGISREESAEEILFDKVLWGM